MIMSKKNIIIVSLVPDEWSQQYQSRHHILKGLSEKYKILWLNPPLYIQDYIEKGYKAKYRHAGLKKIKNNLWSYGTNIPSDYKKKYNDKKLYSKIFLIYRNIWKKIYIQIIKYIIASLNADNVVLYIWRPEYSWITKKLKYDILCYHMDDEYSFSSDKDIEISAEEMYMIKKSDLVFIHSDSLMKKKGFINESTYKVPNGVNYKYFRDTIQSGYDIPYDINNIKHPRIGYLGYVKRHIDLKLIYDIAIRRENWSIIIIGPVREEHIEIKNDIEKLKLLKNVYFLGSKNLSELPAYVNEMDVCIMPYKHTNYTKYIYPMKMYEYFSCGKPVVSTRLENIKEFADIISMAEGYAEWINAIESILVNKDEKKYKSSIKIAENNSWERSFERISNLINEKMQNK